MAALAETSPNVPPVNRFAHAEAQARKRASSKESQGTTPILKKIISGDESSARAKANWKKAGNGIRAMLRFKSGSTPQAAPEGAIPDRFAHGVAVAKRKSLEGQASQSKPSVLKAVTAGARSRGNSADSDTRGSF